jgi:hypothetical protein
MNGQIAELAKQRSALVARCAYFTALALDQLDLRQGVECLRIAGDAKDLEITLGHLSAKLKTKLRDPNSIH